MFKSKTISHLIQTALEEDRARQDITTNSLVGKKHISSTYIISRQEAVVCGTNIVKEIFKKFDKTVKVFAYHKDGEKVAKNAPVLFIKGKTRSILSCERVALNFLGRLSGIATLTCEFVEKVKPYQAKILDTRKTTPGLRDLEKYAVECGGGENHRRDLSDMVLIKDNHLVTLNGTSLAQVIKRIKGKTQRKIEVEVDDLEQLYEVLKAKPDMVLLDNMSSAQLKTAVRLKRLARSKALLEASGGVNLKTVKKIAATGVDRISVGALTHSATGVDFSMEFVK